MNTTPDNFLLVTDEIRVETRGDADMLDLTDELGALITQHRIDEGNVLLFVPGSTAGLTTVEFEPGLLRDIPEFFERIIPQGGRYHHEETWRDGNGHSHVRASLLGPSLVVPVRGGRATLGTWQQVVLIDFDNRPRRRAIVAQLWGRRL